MVYLTVEKNKVPNTVGYGLFLVSIMYGDRKLLDLSYQSTELDAYKIGNACLQNITFERIQELVAEAIHKYYDNLH